MNIYQQFLFSYKTTYKVVIGYTPYQLVYGLHMLMLTKYIMLLIGSDHKKGNCIRVLTSRVSYFKTLQEDKLQSKVKFGMQQWNKTLWNQ